MGSCASTGNVSPPVEETAKVRRRASTGISPSATQVPALSPFPRAYCGAVDNDPLIISSSDGGQADEDTDLTNTVDEFIGTTLREGGHCPARRQPELVSFNEENLNQLGQRASEFADARCHGEPRMGLPSPSSILLKSSSLQSNSGSGGPVQWRQRRTTRANGGGDDDGNGSSSRGSSSRGSSADISGPSPRFLNVDGAHGSEKTPHDEEEEFRRVQAIVNRMHRPSSASGAQGQ